MSPRDLHKGPYLLPSMLPSGSTVSFLDSSFFINSHKTLPSPVDVRLAAGQQATMNRPDPVSFPSMNLIVKYGSIVTIAEGQCLWAVKQLCPNVPVPEVYGWCQDEGETFIYVQKIEALTLEKEWPGLDVEDKYSICLQLRSIIDELRQLRQDPTTPFIGTINQQPMQDVIFDGKKKDGVFTNVESFHDWFSGVGKSGINQDPDPWRPGLLDESSIVFTHSDLHRSNILMSWDDAGMPRVAAIVDWHQSGWYPAPWEFYKTRYTAKDREQWELDFILEFLHPYQGYICWDYFVLKSGN